MTISETTAQTDRAATLRTIADSGLPMPNEIDFSPLFLKLVFDTVDELQAWSDDASAEVCVDRRRSEKHEIWHTWHVGTWRGVQVDLHVFEREAPAEVSA